ncbi:DUF5060 domain-containing protein [Actinopolymorpha alba]|uniref:DUF5060 domain-containing protein n=1 Tax=Actinopolymorpha alba TaxID=533267 RepID=UPI00037745DD|nr:DUF5060 domain-containing protein [Actinopolymorpha alba]
MAGRLEVERWGIFEREFAGPSDGNPFKEVRLSARFQYRNRIVEIDGFYDGDGTYRLRFMPDQPGEWRFVTSSNAPALDGLRGEFVCTAPTPTNHGPVKVAGTYHFRYADGTRYLPFGTTCYHWTHAMEETQERLTLEALAGSAFNKVRMCLLPTGGMTPPLLAFEGDTPGQLDKTRFNPAFFAHVERRLDDLLALGIEADLILFHPYDKGHWGVDNMTREEDTYFLRYVLARLGAYRNVWWSLSNEYDFNTFKSIEDWDHLLRFVQHHDPYQRLRSIHNGTKMYLSSHLYDFTKPWITHQSVQHWDAALTESWLASCAKPVVIDEISYEGDITRRWGNITGQELTHRFWQGMAAGGYVGHGECFADRPSGPWISKGGELYGDSPERIAFLRRIMEEAPADWIEARRLGTYLLDYLGAGQQAYHEVELPDGVDYHVDLIDAWEMTVTPAGTHSGRCRIDLPGRPYLALRFRAASSL